MKTLSSSEEGWYFGYYPGWDNDYKIGGYWYWCKFNADRTVEVASELIYDDPGFLVSKSEFSLIAGRGAVLSFNYYNEALSIFITPSSSLPQGLQGDNEFQIVDVKDNLVTVQGIRTGTIGYFTRKSDGKEASEALNYSRVLDEQISDAPMWATEVKGAVAGTITEEMEKAGAFAPDVFKTDRAFVLAFTVEKKDAGATVYERVDLRIPYITDMAESKIALREPIDVLGNEISGFNFVPTSDAGSGYLVSNDANQTVKLLQVYPPPLLMEDLVGDYTAVVNSYFYGQQSYNVTITQKSDNVVTITGLANAVLAFDATLNSRYRTLVATTPQDTGYGTDSGDILFENAGSKGRPVTFRVSESGVIACSDMWGFTNGPTYWYNVFTSTTITKK
jgi:hypothetical protein